LDARIAAAKSNATTKPSIDLAEAVRARVDRLGRARDMYTKVIEFFHTASASDQPAHDMDQRALKFSYFHRADCVYALGDYIESIKLYGEAAFRYQDDRSSLAAYLGIINANIALGKTEEAKAANERAKWVLRRMPGELFEESVNEFGLSKQHWNDWLNWAGQAGIWK
jgi:tetratricopeptide (TPR) repeat protein